MRFDLLSHFRPWIPILYYRMMKHIMKSHTTLCTWMLCNVLQLTKELGIFQSTKKTQLSKIAVGFFQCVLYMLCFCVLKPFDSLIHSKRRNWYFIQYLQLALLFALIQPIFWQDRHLQTASICMKIFLLNRPVKSRDFDVRCVREKNQAPNHVST